MQADPEHNYKLLPGHGDVAGGFREVKLRTRNTKGGREGWVLLPLMVLLLPLMVLLFPLKILLLPPGDGVQGLDPGAGRGIPRKRKLWLEIRFRGFRMEPWVVTGSFRGASSAEGGRFVPFWYFYGGIRGRGGVDVAMATAAGATWGMAVAFAGGGKGSLVGGDGADKEAGFVHPFLLFEPPGERAEEGEEEGGEGGEEEGGDDVEEGREAEAGGGAGQLDGGEDGREDGGEGEPNGHTGDHVGGVAARKLPKGDPAQASGDP